MASRANILTRLTSKDALQVFATHGGASFRSTYPDFFKHKKGDENETSYSGFLLDIDGVLHKNGVAIDGANEFLKKLKLYDCPFILLTNECRYTNEEISKRLHEVLGEGAPSPSEIYSSANSTRDFFKRLIAKGYRKSTYFIGEKGLLNNLLEAYASLEQSALPGKVISGFEEENEDEIAPVGYVVIGSVFSENTRYVERAAYFIKKGARIVHTCPDLYDVHSDGRFQFGMPIVTVNLLEKSCDVSSYNLGKPNPHMFRMAKNMLISKRNLVVEEILFVGDSIETDIRTSIENGIDCALVLSGCTTEKALNKSALKPNYVFTNVNQIGEMVFCNDKHVVKIHHKYNYKS